MDIASSRQVVVDHQPGSISMSRHTSMQPRIQKTPHGDVTITSKWVHDRYYLVASGSIESIHWLFPGKDCKPEHHRSQYRHVFLPAPSAVTVERDLRKISARWQDVWTSRFEDERSHSDAGELAKSELPSDRPSTVAQLIESYQTARQGELASRTQERNRHYLARWKEMLGGHLLLTELNQERLVEARRKLTTKISIGTTNDSFALLKTVFRWALSLGYLVADPSMVMKSLRDTSDKTEKPWWSLDEVQDALTSARLVDREVAGKTGDVIPTGELLVALGCLLGLRYEEIVMLRWEDIDLDAVHPRTGLPEPVCRIRAHDGWTPKDNESRAIPIQADLAVILRAYRKPAGYILEPKKVVAHVRGKKHTYRYDPQRIWNRIVKKVEAAGGKRISPHGMRHSFASNLLMAGVSDVLVARWLGHSDTSMVQKRYGHLLAYHSDIDRMRLGQNEDQ